MQSSYEGILQTLSGLANTHQALKQRCEELEAEKKFDDLSKTRGAKPLNSLSHKFICLGKHLVNIDHIINIEVMNRFDNGVQLFQHVVYLSNGSRIATNWTPLRVANPCAEYLHQLLDVKHTPNMPRLDPSSGDNMQWKIIPQLNVTADTSIEPVAIDAQDIEDENIRETEEVAKPIIRRRKRTRIIHFPYEIRSPNGQLCKKLPLSRFLECSVMYLDFNHRARTGFKASYIYTVGELLSYSYERLVMIPGLGVDTVNHIVAEISRFGLHLTRPDPQPECITG